MISITIEQSLSDDQKAWGLMKRDELGENHGMLFIYDEPKKLPFWMFNTFMDLSIAFLDKESIITEIYELKAYPQLMNPKHPVNTIEDLKKYPKNDPYLLFFYKNQLVSLKKAKYALEMRSRWFEDNGVKVGHKLFFTKSRSQAYILRD